MLVALGHYPRRPSAPYGSLAFFRMDGSLERHLDVEPLPLEVAVTRAGEVLVAGATWIEERRDSVYNLRWLDEDGKVLRVRALTGWPVALAESDEGDVLVVIENKTAEDETISTMVAFSQEGNSLGQVLLGRRILDMVVSSSGELWMSSTGLIGEYGRDGKPIREWAVSGEPSSIAFADDNSLVTLIRRWEPCPWQAAIERFDLSGELQARQWLFGRPTSVFLPSLSCAAVRASRS